MKKSIPLLLILLSTATSRTGLCLYMKDQLTHSYYSHYLSLSPVSVIVSPVRPDGIGHGEPGQLLDVAPAASHHGAHDAPHQGQGVNLGARAGLALPHLPWAHTRPGAAAAVSSVAPVVTPGSPASITSLERHCVLYWFLTTNALQYFRYIHIY